MKHALLALLLALSASGAYARERIMHFSYPHDMARTVQPLLDQGWTVKFVIEGVIILESPPPSKQPTLSATGERIPVPGGLEERRTKLLATKPEAQKP